MSAADRRRICRRLQAAGGPCGALRREEFALVLPDTGSEAAASIAEALRRAVERLAIPHEASTVGPHVTVSLGVACLVPRHGDSPELLVESADRALYAAKQQGRNRSVASWQ